MDAVLHPPLRGERMGPPGLLVAPHQHLIAGIHEQDLVPVPPLPQGRQHLLHVGKGLVCPHVEAQGDLADVGGGHHDELHELVDEAHRQVVHAVVPLVLQYLDGSGLSAAAHSRHDHKAHIASELSQNSPKKITSGSRRMPECSSTRRCTSRMTFRMSAEVA